jgi:hypothetical protein
LACSFATQGKDVVYRVEVPPGYALIFSGNLVHAGVAGTEEGGRLYRVHAYFGEGRPDDVTYPIDFEKNGERHHVPSMTQRFNIKRE